MPRTGLSRRGSALVMVIVAVSAMGVMSLALLQMTSATGAESDEAIAETEALYLAESAFHEATTSLLSGGPGTLGSEAAPLLFGDGLVWTRTEEIEQDVYLVTSTGMSDAGRRTVEGVVRRSVGGGIGFALFSDKKLDFKKEILVDSFDSDLGTYASQATNIVDGTAYAGTDGDVVSNGDIRLDKDIRIFGDVSYGPGGELKTKDKDGGPHVSGETFELGSALDYPAVQPPASTPSSLGDLHLHGDPLSDEPDLILGPGMVHYDKLKIHKDAKVKIVGPATVVVDEKFELDSDLIIDGTNGQVALYVGEKLHLKKKNTIQVLSGRPEDLIVLVGTKTDKKGKIKKNKVKLEGTFTGVLYAPHARVDFKKEAEVFGAIIADSVKLHKNTRIHYDEALERMTSEHVGDPVMSLLSLYVTNLDSERARRLRGDPFAVLGVDRNELASLSESWKPQFESDSDPDEYWAEDEFPWVDENWWPDADDEADDEDQSEDDD